MSNNKMSDAKMSDAKMSDAKMSGPIWSHWWRQIWHCQFYSIVFLRCTFTDTVCQYDLPLSKINLNCFTKGPIWQSCRLEKLLIAYLGRWLVEHPILGTTQYRLWLVDQIGWEKSVCIIMLCTLTKVNYPCLFQHLPGWPDKYVKNRPKCSPIHFAQINV
jgi:hypothetical protein